MAHFKSIQLTGTTYNEAYATGPFVGEPHKNATQAWKNYLTKNPGMAITEAVKRQWMEDYLKKETKGNPGIGCYIVEVPAVKSDRKRPYVIEKIKNDKGARKFKRVYVGINEVTGKEEFICKTNASDADTMLKEYYINGGTDPVKIDVRMDCVEGVVTIRRGKYAPSKGSHPCTIVAFGMVAD